MSAFLYDVGRWCFRRRGRVLLAWLGLLLVVAGTAMAIRQPTSDSFNIPGAPSQTAYDQLRMTFPSAADSTSTFVVTIPDGHSFHDADIQHTIEAGLDDIATRPYVKGVISPYNEYVKGQIATDGRTAKLTVRVVGTATSFTAASLKGFMGRWRLN